MAAGHRSGAPWHEGAPSTAWRHARDILNRTRRHGDRDGSGAGDIAGSTDFRLVTLKAHRYSRIVYPVPFAFRQPFCGVPSLSRPTRAPQRRGRPVGLSGQVAPIHPAARSGKAESGKRRMIGQEKENEYSLCAYGVVRFRGAAHVFGFIRASPRLGFVWSARAARLRTASLPRRWLYLDARLLGLERRRRRLLLGTRHMGTGAGSRLPLDPTVLGMG